MSLLDRLQAQTNRAAVTDQRQQTAVPPPSVPCPACSCQAYWQDTYRREQSPWRCLHCVPPPLESFVWRWIDCRAVQPAPEAAAGHPAILARDLDDLADWTVEKITRGPTTWLAGRRRVVRASPPAGVLLAEWVETLGTGREQEIGRWVARRR
jgi:hypothetical protein